MKRIVIIGANDFQNQLIMKAKNMGYETHVFAWKDGAIGEQNADFFYPISIIEKELILNECKKIKPDAIVTIASDLAVITVNYVAEKLGLVGNGIATTKFTTNKYEMRKCLVENDLPVPNFCISGSDTEINLMNFKFPLIVKPTDRSGSRGVTKVNNKEELEKAIQNAISFSFEKKAIIEEFLEGDEYSCEFISYNGEHHLLAVTKKFTTGSPHFIETGHLEPAPLTKSKYKEIRNIIELALNSLSIRNGASHSEIKIDENGDIGIIEIGARMGGDCIGSDLVLLSTGNDYLKMVIQVALGIKPKVSQCISTKKAGIKFLFNKQDIKQLNELQKLCPKSLYRISIDSENDREVIDSSTRLGYYIFAGDDVDTILKELRYE